jgi:hypothetical protein
VLQVDSQAVSAVLRVPWPTAATTGTGIRFVDPNGAASCAAFSLGALAGRKALLLPWVTLFSDGRKCGTATAAISQAAMTNQRNLTANAPIPPKMAWMRTRKAYWVPRRTTPPDPPAGGEGPPGGTWPGSVGRLEVSFGTMALISVVIPVHGVEDYLDRCLDSVLGPAAGPADIEVIAIDDASPDRCGAILAARRDPRLRVISTPAALGPGAARDLGAKEATGEYVWFVDGDDELAEGALPAVSESLTRLRPDVLIVDFENLYPDGTTSPSGGAKYLAGPAVTTLADHPWADSPDDDGMEQGVPPRFPVRPGYLVRLLGTRSARGRAGHHDGVADRGENRRARPGVLPVPAGAARLVPGRRERR